MSFIEGNKGTLGLTALAIVTTVLALLAIVLISKKIFGSSKKRSAGKRKELQRPFVKRKQASPRGKKWTRSFIQLPDLRLLKNSWSNYNITSDNIVDKKNKLAQPSILSTVIATIKDSNENDSPDIINRQTLAPHVTDLVDTFDSNDDGINATSFNSKYVTSDKASSEDTVQNVFVLRKKRRCSASPPESRIGNLSNQSAGYLLGSNSASPNEFDHSYCQLRLYDSLQHTMSTDNIFDGHCDDMSVSLVWEELLSDNTTESSRSFKNSISSYTDMSQISIGDELENSYKYSQSLGCRCPEMMTFGIKEMWAHKCNSLLPFQGNTSWTVSSQEEENHCESSESTNQDYDVPNSNQKFYNSVDLKSHFSNEDCITSSKQSISSRSSCKESHFSDETVGSNATVTANTSLNQNCSLSYYNHILRQKLGKDFTAFTSKVSSTNGNFETLQRNHSQFDSRRWYSLGSLCDESHGCSNDVIEHDYAHTHGQDRVKVDLDYTPEPYNDTGYTSTAETDSSPVKENSEVESGSYDADCESDVGDNAESVLVNGEVEKVSDDDEIKKSLPSIGEAVLIADYSKKEWKGKTTTAETMRKGYAAIPSCVNCQHLRQVRGDNYCAIRAALFQALLNNVPVLAKYPDTVNLSKMPEQLLSKGLTWIRSWNFGNRIELGVNDILKTLQAYLMAFVKEVDEVNSFKSKSERMAHLLSVFNKDFLNVELKLLEAVKFLMLCSAVDLHEKLIAGETVPTFALLMFARDTCPDPQSFLLEHLNHVGDSAGLEQVEMHLLGYTLNVLLKVVRPIQYEKEDFIVHYPSQEDASIHLPSVTLIAEDDRHYNIIM